MNTAIQNALDEAGIESPFPAQSLVHQLDPDLQEKLPGFSGEEEQNSS